MDLCGEKVKHKKLGVGIIENIKNNYMDIRFNNNEMKTFLFPSAFYNFLEPFDDIAKQKIDECINIEKTCEKVKRKVEEARSAEEARKARILREVRETSAISEIREIRAIREARKDEEAIKAEEIRKLKKEYNEKKLNEELIKKQENKIIQETINLLEKEYNFKGLWHFSDFSNLQSIFHTRNLFSRQDCLEHGITFNDGADKEVLKHTSEIVKRYVRFYYRAQVPTLYDNEGIKRKEFLNGPHIPRPVYLLFSKDIMFKNVLFSTGSAASRGSNIGEAYKILPNMEWSCVFHNGSFTPEERDKIINKRHAEVLSIESIGLEYLKQIIFRSESDYKQACNMWPHLKEYMVVDSELFSKKNNLPIDNKYYNNYVSNYEVYYQKANADTVVVVEFRRALGSYAIENLLKDCVTNKEIMLNVIRMKDSNNNFTKNIANAKKMLLKCRRNIDANYKLNIIMNGFMCVNVRI